MKDITDTNQQYKRWYACVYDKTFQETDDIEFLLKIIGSEPKNVLEVCCGTGRILVPLAKEGHYVTGFDIDEYMMERIPGKTNGLKNINYFKADAIADDWGKNYDVVVLACNIMMNIITEENIKEPQKVFIEKAANALKIGGYVYMDFGLFEENEDDNKSESPEWVIFEGYDDKGINGKFIMCAGSSYNKNTQMSYGNRRIELFSGNGEKNAYEYSFNKRIPKLDETKKWLNENNFTIEQIYGNYNREPINEKSKRVIIYARKG